MKKILFPRIGAFPFNNLAAVLINLGIAYLIYMITRVAFVLENWNRFSAGWDALSTCDLLSGSLRFDTSAIFYTHALWIVLMLLPVYLKERHWWHSMCKYIFVSVNSLAIFLNLADSVYFPYTDRRTTVTFFSEFSNEGNLGGIFFIEVLNHWYLLLLAIVLIAALVLFYVKPSLSNTSVLSTRKPLNYMTAKAQYYTVNSLFLLLFIPLSIGAMRGGFTKAVRPITLSNANQYVNNPTEAAIVLNTPFTLIRSIGKKPFVHPHYMSDEQMNALYSPLHSNNQAHKQSSNKNVVILIVESFGREYSGYFNPTLEDGTYQSYTPFFDSLASHSLTFQYSFANGRKSIDGMPSILSSIPMFVEPFFVTSSALNDVSGFAGLLADKGYSSAFFHGAENGSMGFQAFARTTGFQRYYGRTEYNADTRFGGDKDFDGNWAIWDEPFLQFYALTMNDLPRPFVTAVFTASSHHPYNIPSQYRNTFPEGPLPIHKCIRYTDNALRRFFETASQQPWYNNTIFVITADHTNTTNHDEYRSSLGLFSVPIVIFDPSGELPRGMQPTVAQQIDILPTLLSILGYDKPYIAFGKDLLDTSNVNHFNQSNVQGWAVNYCNVTYQYVEDDLLLLFDGEKPTALYNYVADPLQQNNLLRTRAVEQPDIQANLNHMTLRLKALIQSYMIRMTDNRLVVRPDDLKIDK